MANKSIHQVEITGYEQFIKAFQEYHEMMNGQSDAWNKITEAAGEAEKPLSTISDDTRAILSGLNGISEQMIRFNRQGKFAESQAANTKKHYLEILGFSQKTTQQLIKWGSIGMGVAGTVASGVALVAGVAQSGANLRKETKTLGISAGELESQKANLGKFIDVGSHLHGLNAIRSDLSKRGYMAAAGLSGMENLSNSEFLAQSLLKVRQTYVKHGGTEQAAQAYGLHELGFSTDELQLLKNTTEAEIRAAIEKEKIDRKQLNQTDEQLKAWQDLNIQIDIFTRQLKTLTADVLTPVLKFLNADTTLTDDKIKQNIEDAKKQKTKEKSFLDYFFGAAPLSNEGIAQAEKQLSPSAKSSSIKSKDKLAQIRETEKLHGLPAGTLLGQWGAESEYGKNKGYSSKGALGDFQFKLSTAKAYGVEDRMDFSQSLSGAGKYMEYLMKLFKNDVRKALAAYNWGEGKVQRDIAKHGKDWEKYLPSETKGYISKVLSTSTNVTINNNTGGSAVVALNSTAH